MPPTEATIPLTNDGNRIVKPSVTIVPKEANRRQAQSAVAEHETVPDASSTPTANENGNLPAGEQQQQHLSWLGRLSYHVSISIGQFFYRWVKHLFAFSLVHAMSCTIVLGGLFHLLSRVLPISFKSKRRIEVLFVLFVVFLCFFFVR